MSISIDREARNITVEKLFEMKQESGDSIAVVIPAYNEESTIAFELNCIKNDLVDNLPLIDELIVIDGDSDDRTASIARDCGASVYSVSDGVAAAFPAGKGTAMWSSLSHISSSIVVFVDADIENFGTHFVTALIAPFLENRSVSFVKAFYDRPLHNRDGELQKSGGGRVTELLIRPLFSRFFPDASGFVQPLSGEYGFRVDLLKKLRFYSSYGVETSLNLDYIRKFGTENIVQVDLGERVHRNRPLHELSEMSSIILQTFVDFAEEDGILNSEAKGSDNLQRFKQGEPEQYGVTQVRLPLYSEVMNDGSTRNL